MASPRVRHYSLRTEQAEIHWIKLFIFFHHKCQPVEMGKREFEQFLSIMKMPTRLTLLPGDRGAKQLHEQYGEQLVCVCYRYDEQQQKRLKIGELIVGETDWILPASQRQRDSVVSLRVTAFEREVREHVKRAGGAWKPARRVWELRYDQVVLLESEERIMAAHSI